MKPTHTQAYRVLVVDPHPVLRAGLASLLAQQEDLEGCGQVGNGHEALALIAELRPDLVITELNLFDMNGLEFLKVLRQQAPAVRVLIFSAYLEDVYAERALRAGAKGYVSKNAPVEELLVAIRRALGGGVYLSDAAANRIVARLAGSPGEHVDPELHRLTDRELQVFELIGQGHASSTIARMLGVSVKTIEAHREHMKHKLKVRGASELVQRAVLWVQMSTASARPGDPGGK